MESITNDLIKAAAFFVNSTGSHIFLTGKAGTGKTTFLRNLALSTHKNFVIVAPTGIAALNAGGVTIHSQFQLPLGTFIPDRSPSGNFNSESSVYTQYTLNRKHPISALRKQVLRSIELLIIDEVSMLRADVLDAIDYRMRSVKGDFHRSFGGVQVLLIGDLYQLPPIVKDHEWSYLKRYYHSAHFFEAKALSDDGFVLIELDKIFRQSDNTFINILNNLRNNVTTQADIDTLNKYYKPLVETSEEDEIITITTHNYKAEEINRNALNRLPDKPTIYKASIQDEFAESIFPIPENLELKLNAQVMFVKNDTSGNGRYFNGKLARVVQLDDEEVIVQMSGSNDRLKLEKEVWENKKYTVNATTKELDEEVIGSFTQYPVKLAWAVTVHKSQGLTFEKAIIDVGQAFAPGQVYVALSRLKSLDGLVLRTKIDTRVISSDQLVVEFSGKKKDLQHDLTVVLQEKQHAYLKDLFISTFSFSIIIHELEHFQKTNTSEAEFEDETMRSALNVLTKSMAVEVENTKKFQNQIVYLLNQNEHETLLERLEKGAAYYLNFLKDHVRKLILHSAQVRRYSRQKTYLNGIEELDQLLMKKLEDIEKCSAITKAVLQNAEHIDLKELKQRRDAERIQWYNEALQLTQELPDRKGSKTGKIRKPKDEKKEKKVKGETVHESLKLFKSGMSPKQIAAERSLTVGTVEGHLFKACELELISLPDVVNEVELSEINRYLPEFAEDNNKGLFEKLGGKYSYAKLKAVRIYSLSEKKV